MIGESEDEMEVDKKKGCLCNNEARKQSNFGLGILLPDSLSVRVGLPCSLQVMKVACGRVIGIFFASI